MSQESELSSQRLHLLYSRFAVKINFELEALKVICGETTIRMDFWIRYGLYQPAVDLVLITVAGGSGQAYDV